MKQHGQTGFLIFLHLSGALLLLQCLMEGGHPADALLGPSQGLQQSKTFTAYHYQEKHETPPATATKPQFLSSQDPSFLLLFFPSPLAVAGHKEKQPQGVPVPPSRGHTTATRGHAHDEHRAKEPGWTRARCFPGREGTPTSAAPSSSKMSSAGSSGIKAQPAQRSSAPRPPHLPVPLR